MKNPLSLEERLDCWHSIVHDFGNVSMLMSDGISKLETFEFSSKHKNYLAKKLGDKFKHMLRIFDACRSISSDDIFLERYSQENIFGMLFELTGLAASVYKKTGIMVTAYKIDPLPSNLSMLCAAVYNLVKNSCKENAGNSLNVTINVARYSGEIANALYMPAGMEGKDCVSFTVHDDGIGFSPGKISGDLLKKQDMSKQLSGFGLYYVGLVCKALQCAFSVESQKGSTTATIYHPLDLGIRMATAQQN